MKAYLFSFPKNVLSDIEWYPGCQRLFKRGFRFLSSLYSDPREKPLEQSAIALMAPIQSLARLNRLVQILDKTADWLLTTTWGTLNLTDATMNDFPVIGYSCFAYRILGPLGGKHCESLQRIVCRGVVSPLTTWLKAVSLDIECRTLPWFYEKQRWLMLVRWNFKFLCD